jgi:hypothetical protein
LHFHRRAVVFENDTAVVFETRAAVHPEQTRVAELGFFVREPQAAGRGSGPRILHDPWGTRVVLFPIESAGGLAHAVLYAEDTASLTERAAKIAGVTESTLPHAPARTGIVFGSAWLAFEPAPAGVPLNRARLGLSIGDLSAIPERLQRGGAEIRTGPARFFDFQIVDVLLVPGIELEVVESPPAPDG